MSDDLAPAIKVWFQSATPQDRFTVIDGTGLEVIAAQGCETIDSRYESGCFSLNEDGEEDRLVYDDGYADRQACAPCIVRRALGLPPGNRGYVGNPTPVESV